MPNSINTVDLGGRELPVNFGSFPAMVVAAAFTRIATFGVAGRRGRLGIRGKVTVAALTSMRLLRTMKPGNMDLDDYTVLALDTDFATLAGTLEIQNVMPAAIHTTAAGAAFDLILNTDGVAEYALECKSGGTAQVALNYICN